MKKLFILLMLTGFIGAASATSLISVNENANICIPQDSTKVKACCKKHENHDCSKHEKGKCNKGACEHAAKGHDCSKHPKGECHANGHGHEHHDCSKHEKGKCDHAHTKAKAHHCEKHPDGKEGCCK